MSKPDDHELAQLIRMARHDSAYLAGYLLRLTTNIADGNTYGLTPAEYARKHLEVLALGVPTAGGVG